MAEGFEVFRHPSHAAQALRTLPDRIVPELRPFFKDRASSLDTIYRTLAVTDYTWAARFPEPPCGPRSRRRALLAGKDGLFTDPKTGELSSWLARLLGPAAYGRGAEEALDRASSKRSLAERDYELLRLKVRKISDALESEKAVCSARSRLYCARAQAYVELASAHRTAPGAPIQAARGIGDSHARDHARAAASIVLLARVEGPDRYRALGAGVIIATKKGSRVLTDARLLPESAEDKLSLRAFARPQDGKTLGAAIEFIVEKNDPASGVMVGRLLGGEPIPALKLAGAEPLLNDLVRAIGHMSGTGAWTVSQGLVTAAGKGTFATDALLGAEMLGSPLLNDQGEVAGLAVLRDGTRMPSAVDSSLLRELLADDGQVPASSDIEFIEGHNRGSASILSAAMPTVGAGLTAPGVKPMEASQYIYTQTQWGTVRGKCMANCGNGTPSRGSSPSRSNYNSGGEELGKALGEALAPVVEALIFKGVPALFRGIGSLFSKSKSAPAAPPRRTPAREPVKAPEKPKEPARLTGLSLEAAPRTAAPGEKVTLTARVSLSDPEASKANIAVGFSASPATLARF
ncbi:MAG: serine protease, partial [Elusimicrobia bacterium]|nr:serine protease [Elusimicrobiota bacterium]